METEITLGRINYIMINYLKNKQDSKILMHTDKKGGQEDPYIYLCVCSKEIIMTNSNKN